METLKANYDVTETNEDKEKNDVSVPPPSAGHRLASPAKTSVPQPPKTRDASTCSATCMHGLWRGIKRGFLPLIPLGVIILFGVFLGVLVAFGAVVMLIGNGVFKTAQRIPLEKHVALIGAVGAGVAITAGFISIPFALAILGSKRFWMGPPALYILCLMWVGPIGAAILHSFDFELQISILDATKDSVVGFFILLLALCAKSITLVFIFWN